MNFETEMQSPQLEKLCSSCRTRTRVKFGKKSTPRANRLSYEFTWLWRCKYSIYTVSLSSVYKLDGLNIYIPFQYFTYFDEHKLTGVMVTSQCVMFTYTLIIYIVYCLYCCSCRSKQKHVGLVGNSYE